MFSYVIGLFAILVLVANPISQYFFPQTSRTKNSLSPRPQLNESLLAIDVANGSVPDCPADAYGARILSREPLVVYLEGFLSESERKHLLDISEPIFEPSTITDDSSSAHRDSTIRDSAVALLPRTDIVRCIEACARAFQGWRRDLWIERLRTQRYVAGGHYNHHFDWSRNANGWGRVSSFMAWVDAADGLEGGGTEFPLLETITEGNRPKWCELVECEGGRAADADGQRDQKKAGGEAEEEEAGGKGTTFRAIPGNAVYWENFASDGRGYDETWHAGLPVKRGVKVGLNIWSFGRIE